MDSQIDLCRYDMERVSFIRRGPSGEYLALEIEGLAEGRPSLLTGDAIEVNSSWMDKNGKCSFSVAIDYVFFINHF